MALIESGIHEALLVYIPIVTNLSYLQLTIFYYTINSLQTTFEQEGGGGGLSILIYQFVDLKTSTSTNEGTPFQNPENACSCSCLEERTKTEPK